jgi:hypothetical protein
MYSLENYIKTNASRLTWITDAAKQIVPVAGLDRAASLLQSYSGNVYPIILIEDTGGGYVNFEAEFLDVSVHNLWIMNKPKNPDSAGDRSMVMEECYRYGLDILKMIVADENDTDSMHGWNPIPSRWSRKRTSYMPMSNVGLCYGYMFMLNFNTDLSLIENE